MGAEWWVRRPKGSASPTVADIVETTPDDTQGVLKGRISTNYVSLYIVDIHT
jgi:hypothetical protein